jgi:hypothetical protein
MDPFKKSLLLFGFMIPALSAVALCTGILTIRAEVGREFKRRTTTYGEMKRQEDALKIADRDRSLLSSELPKIRGYFHVNTMAQATSKIAAECSDEKGIKLGDLKEAVTSSNTKTHSHQIKLLARSGPLLDVIGNVQSSFPGVQIDHWSLVIQSDQKILLFQGTLNLAADP